MTGGVFQHPTRCKPDSSSTDDQEAPERVHPGVRLGKKATFCLFDFSFRVKMTHNLPSGETEHTRPRSQQTSRPDMALRVGGEER